MVAGVPMAILLKLKLDSRKFVYIPRDDVEGRERQLKKWKALDLAAWLWGIGYCAISVLFCAAFIANVSLDASTQWFVSSGTSLAKEAVLDPIKSSFRIVAMCAAYRLWNKEHATAACQVLFLEKTEKKASDVDTTADVVLSLPEESAEEQAKDQGKDDFPDEPSPTGKVILPVSIAPSTPVAYGMSPAKQVFGKVQIFGKIRQAGRSLSGRQMVYHEDLSTLPIPNTRTDGTPVGNGISDSSVMQVPDDGPRGGVFGKIKITPTAPPNVVPIPNTPDGVTPVGNGVSAS